MWLKTLVKVSINNLSDARYCASMGVQLIGIPIDPSQEGYITPEQCHELMQWVHGVKLVGEVHQADANTIQGIINNYPIDYLQCNHPIEPNLLVHVKHPILIRLVLQGDETQARLISVLSNYAKLATYFVLDTRVSDLAILNRLQNQVKALTEQFPILQGFHLTTNNIPYLLADTQLKGLALQGGTEIKPGYKDFDDLSNLLTPLLEECPF